MTAKQIDHLVKMAEQIALNMAPGYADGTARRCADHLRRFWTPAMRGQLTVFWQEGGEVSADLAAALRELNE
ncbi:MAG: formate dehydrogenase subunit delta [Halieaceae bacterium]|nr:formate dehydrogenase subunit delta [Halieaceae bacterium]